MHAERACETARSQHPPHPPHLTPVLLPALQPTPNHTRKPTFLCRWAAAAMRLLESMEFTPRHARLGVSGVLPGRGRHSRCRGVHLLDLLHIVTRDLPRPARRLAPPCKQVFDRLVACCLLVAITLHLVADHRDEGLVALVKTLLALCASSGARNEHVSKSGSTTKHVRGSRSDGE